MQCSAVRVKCVRGSPVYLEARGGELRPEQREGDPQHGRMAQSPRGRPKHQQRLLPHTQSHTNTGGRTRQTPAVLQLVLPPCGALTCARVLLVSSPGVMR